MPYLLVKGQGNNIADTSVFANSDVNEIKKQLQVSYFADFSYNSEI